MHTTKVKTIGESVVVDIYAVVSGYNTNNDVTRKALTGIINVYDCVDNVQDKYKTIFSIEKDFLSLLKAGLGVIQMTKVMTKKEFLKIKKSQFKDFVIVKHIKPYQFKEKIN